MPQNYGNQHKTFTRHMTRSMTELNEQETNNQHKRRHPKMGEQRKHFAIEKTKAQTD